MLDISKQSELMIDAVPIEQGLKEEFEWYKNNLEKELSYLLRLFTHLHELGVPGNSEHLQKT